MTEELQSKSLSNLFDLIRNTRAEQRVTMLLATQLLGDMAMATADPRDYSENVMKQIAVNLDKLTTLLPPEDSYTRDEIKESHEYLGRVREALDTALATAIKQWSN